MGLGGVVAVYRTGSRIQLTAAGQDGEVLQGEQYRGADLYACGGDLIDLSGYDLADRDDRYPCE